MKLLDPDDPFFAQPWRRWATVVLPGAWAAFELGWGSPGWAVLFGAAAAYALWALILAPRRP